MAIYNTCTSAPNIMSPAPMDHGNAICTQGNTYLPLASKIILPAPISIVQYHLFLVYYYLQCPGLNLIPPALLVMPPAPTAIPPIKPSTYIQWTQHEPV